MPIELYETRAPLMKDWAEFLGLHISTLPRSAVIERLTDLAQRGSFAFVVTPNVDHVMKLDREAKRAGDHPFTQAYGAAALRLCDSRILARIARFYGLSFPVVTGSDLTEALFRTAFSADHSVAIIGGDQQTLAQLAHLFPDPTYHHHAPPMGLLNNPAAMEAVVDFVCTAGADFTLFAIGAPQSEIIAAKCLQRPNAAGSGARGVGLCIGASIDFLLGQQVRAPKWVQRAGFEWAFRLIQSPKRLWRRYLVEGPRIFWLAAQWNRAKGNRAKGAKP